jgi:hypothetical protein
LVARGAKLIETMAVRDMLREFRGLRPKDALIKPAGG